ncbi:MAG: hypothetical protein E6G34_10655 [Actinobacteria bacterium]|nr:MAG: hypothetical protein E6G34_10655 [Actinomycetota bacterium]
MRTLILSDLHLGSPSHSDLLRRADVRSPLLEEAGEVDRVVLLGDVLELRQGPAREALAAARPFFEDLGRALAGRELVLVAGNHDHALLEPWLSRRGELDAPPPLELEQLISPSQASPMAERIAEWASPARVQAAYPGLWVRADVYATHGHYLDCHLTVPTIERLSVGVMARLLGRHPESFQSVEDYEAVTAPMYAWRHAVARVARTTGPLNGDATVHAWRTLAGRRRPAAPAGGLARARRAAISRKLGTRALVAGFPLAVAALNRAGIGPLRADISVGELRRAGLRAMSEVARRLGLGDAYVVFGHTHRAGPLAGDRDLEWAGRERAAEEPARARLVNAGCWTYERVFLSRRPGESPYWPGGCVLVEDSGAPQLKRLLLDRTHDELRSSARASASA